jgi:predicted nucleic acid-binding protein
MEGRSEGRAEKPRLILVDSSVWIDFFSPLPSRAGKELRRMIADAEPFAIAGVVVAEILQGLTRDVGQIERYLSMWDILEPAGFSTYRDAAAIFRLARSKGISLSMIDTLIAAIAMHRAAVFTLDKDFSRIARLTNLPLHALPNP